MFSSYNPNRQLTMVRNPYFKQWSKAAQPAGYPDRITYSFGLTVEAQITAIQNESGRLDARGAAGGPARRARQEATRSRCTSTR